MLIFGNLIRNVDQKLDITKKLLNLKMSEGIYIIAIIQFGICGSRPKIKLESYVRAYLTILNTIWGPRYVDVAHKQSALMTGRSHTFPAEPAGRMRN
jgi:hypothetical protein